MKTDKSPPRLNINGAFIMRTDFSYALLQNANLSKVNASGTLFVGSDFENANLEGTILKGADLRKARNLTALQLSRAIIDETTLLPDYLTLDDIKSISL